MRFRNKFSTLEISNTKQATGAPGLHFLEYLVKFEKCDLISKEFVFKIFVPIFKLVMRSRKKAMGKV